MKQSSVNAFSLLLKWVIRREMVIRQGGWDHYFFRFKGKYLGKYSYRHIKTRVYHHQFSLDFWLDWELP